MTPIQTTLATALRHWYGDAQGQHAHIFRGVSLETVRTVRQQVAVRQAEAQVETVARTGDVVATQAACQVLTRVYTRVLRQCREEVAA